MAQNKVGKKTPVWQNSETGRVVCGTTVQDGLGVGFMYDVGKGWNRVKQLPMDQRVVIHNGVVLPKNILTSRIVEEAVCPAIYNIKIGTRSYHIKVLYADKTRVIIA